MISDAFSFGVLERSHRIMCFQIVNPLIVLMLLKKIGGLNSLWFLSFSVSFLNSMKMSISPKRQNCVWMMMAYSVPAAHLRDHQLLVAMIACAGNAPCFITLHP